MAKISHFVVTYNHETGAWDIDDGTASVRFEDGTVWNTETSEWEHSNDIDWRAGEELNDVLHQLNIENGVDEDEE